MAKAKLFLIDGHALCYRCFFAIKALATSRGQPTNAIYGFVRTIRNILKEKRPDYMAVCFDSPKKTHRQEKFAAYKIQRPPMPEDLKSQIPIIKDVMRAFHVPVFEMGGFEADDIIATLSQKFAKKDMDIVIVSDDKDMYQLAGKNIKFFGSKNGTMLDSRELEEKLGFEPSRIVDFIGLVGDKTDNIPGVKGIGAVHARQLINEFGSLEGIFNHVTQVKNPKAREKLLVDQRETAMFSKELAVLDTSVPLEYDLKTLEVQGPDNKRVFEIFQDLEFRKLAEEFAPQESGAPIDVHAVDSPPGFKSLADRIQREGRFSFIIDSREEEGLFINAAVYIAVGNQEVFSVELNVISMLKSVFENSGILKLTYNIKEMLKILSRYDICVEGGVFDVMLAGYLLGPSPSSFDLDHLAWRYLGRSVANGQKAAGKALAVERLHPLLAGELKDKSLMPLFEDIEMPLAYVLYKVEANGVNLDLGLLKKLSKECLQKTEELKATLYAMVGEEFNLNSPKQLSHVLFQKLKLPVIKKTKTGFSTNETVLNVLAGKHAVPSLILEYRQLAKLQSTYIDALPKLVNPQTGRVHAQFNQTGTETGRLSSSRPNLQNIPVRTQLGQQIRRAIIPSEKNFVMIAADYSQIELRILAHLSGDKNLIKAFKEGEDVHTFTASMIFEVDENNVTASMRNAAKRVNFGIIYGMSAFGLANDIKVTQSEAQAFIDRYFLRYPAVKEFMDDEIKKCETNGYVLTLLNRRRYIPEISSTNEAVRQFARRQAINTPVQGSAADLMKLAMINIQKEIEERRLSTKMISTVHDELVFEAPPAEQNAAVGLIRRQMENAVALTVFVKVSVKVGKNWLDMEEV